MQVSRHNAILLRNARVIDPHQGQDGITDLAVVDGRIAAAAPRDAAPSDSRGRSAKHEGLRADAASGMLRTVRTETSRPGRGLCHADCY